MLSVLLPLCGELVMVNLPVQARIHMLGDVLLAFC